MKHLPRLEIKSATRIIEHGPPVNCLVAISAPLEHKNGYVFMLADIERRCKATRAISSLFQETTDRLTRRLQEQSHLQHRFEQTLQALNSDLSHIFASKTASPTQLHAMIGVVQHQTFILAGTGALTALFLRKNIKQHVRFFDLMHNLASESGPPHAEKFFSTVLDGTLCEDDVMLFATGPFQTYVSLEEAHPLFTTLPPTSVLESMDASFPIRAQSAVILFQIKPEKSVLTGFGTSLGVKESMRALSHVEEEASKRLGLQTPHMQEAFSHLVSLVRSGTTKERLAFVQNAAARIWKGARILASYAFRVASNAAASLVSFVGVLFQRGEKRKRGFSQAMSAWNRTWKTGRYQFFRLSKSYQIILVVCAVLLVALSLTIYAVRLRQRSTASTQTFMTSIERIDGLIDAAQASLIYNDRATATAQLKEAEITLQSLTIESENQQQQTEEQRAALAATWSDVRRVLSPQLTRLMVPTQNAVGTNGSLIFASDGSAWRINGSSVTESSIANASGILPRRATAYKTDTVFLAADDRMGRYRAAEGSIQSVHINAAESELSKAIALEHYGERLYILVGEQGQIYRHQLVDDADYASATPWLSDSVTFEKARDLAIDGTVWVVDGSRVRHFDKGREIGFAQTAIDPPLQSATAVWTSADVPELFVLESAQNRLLVLNKESGELIGQYTDPSFAPAVDLHINYVDRNAYIVTPNQVLLFPLINTIQSYGVRP